MTQLLILASFTAPEQVGVNPQSMLWLLPLAAAIAIVYKAIKLQNITTGYFVKEVAGLFGSIVVFIVVSALILFILARLVTG